MKRAVLILACWLAASLPAWADDWPGMSPSNFPAKVQSVTFSNGDVIDSGHTECWGKWCVTLDGGNKTVAQYANNNGLVLISLSPLSCHNDVAGDIAGSAAGNECRMDLLNGRNGPTCGLAIFKNNQSYSFNIQCPADLKLK
jgi:hypothetical protein